MDYYSGDKLWQCYACGHEEAEDAPDTSGENDKPKSTPEAPLDPDLMPDSSEPATTPLSDTQSDDRHWANERSSRIVSPKKESASHSLQPTKKKNCPSCGKKMNFFPMENAWRCPYCDYERKI